MNRLPRSSFVAALVVVLAAVVGSAVGPLGGGCVTQGPCQCLVCSNAISLFVVDENGAAIDDGWEVEATLDGLAVDTSACSPGVRTGNQCAFGVESGVYDIVVRTSSEEKHVNGRAAATGGLDCCTGVCIPTENIPVVLGAQ